MKLICVIAVAMQVGACSILAQPQIFRDLDFEQANIPPGAQPGSDYSTNALIPGWVASRDIFYDGESLGGAFVSISDSQTPFLNFSPLQGNYSVILYAGPDGPAFTSAISQTGRVPGSAESILMDIAFPLGPAFAGAFTVSLGSQQIPMLPLESFPDYTVYGGDVSAFVGQLETLTITQFPPVFPTVPPSALAVDDIVFSPSEIPEPETWALLLCGAGLFALRRKTKK